MSVNWFLEILRFIRFDNKNTKVEPLQNDKAVAICDL